MNFSEDQTLHIICILPGLRLNAPLTRDTGVVEKRVDTTTTAHGEIKDVFRIDTFKCFGERITFKMVLIHCLKLPLLEINKYIFSA